MIGAESIKDVQCNPGLATVKHWAVNDQETNRFTISSQVDDRTLHEIYTTPYEIAVREAKPGAAMCSFNKINGVYACGNPLMNTLLKGEYGFRGFIMSDYNATPADTAQAANNGLDQEQPGDQGPGSANFGARLVAAVNDGRVPLSRVDDMVRRQLRPIIGLGLIEHPVLMDRFNEQEHGQVARRVAQEGTVLLEEQPRHAAAQARPAAALARRDRTRRRQRLRQGRRIVDDLQADLRGQPARRDHRTRGLALRGSRTRQAPTASRRATFCPARRPCPRRCCGPAGGAPSDRGLHGQFWGNTTFSGPAGARPGRSQRQRQLGLSELQRFQRGIAEGDELTGRDRELRAAGQSVGPLDR